MSLQFLQEWSATELEGTLAPVACTSSMVVESREQDCVMIVAYPGMQYAYVSIVLWKFPYQRFHRRVNKSQTLKTSDTDIWIGTKLLRCRKAVHYNFVTNENETSFVFVFCIYHKARSNRCRISRRNQPQFLFKRVMRPILTTDLAKRLEWLNIVHSRIWYRCGPSVWFLSP